MRQIAKHLLMYVYKFGTWINPPMPLLRFSFQNNLVGLKRAVCWILHDRNISELMGNVQCLGISSIDTRREEGL